MKLQEKKQELLTATAEEAGARAAASDPAAVLKGPVLSDTVSTLYMEAFK